MALTPEQTQALTAVREAFKVEHVPTRYDMQYSLETVDYYIESAIENVNHWVAVRDFITAPDFEARKRAAEEARLAKIAESSERNRDKIVAGWILNLAQTARKAFPDRAITTVSNEEGTSLVVSSDDPDFTEVKLAYRKATKTFSTHIDDVTYLSEPANTVHGSASPYTLFKGFAAVKDHFDKLIAAQD